MIKRGQKFRNKLTSIDYVALNDMITVERNSGELNRFATAISVDGKRHGTIGVHPKLNVINEYDLVSEDELIPSDYVYEGMWKSVKDFNDKKLSFK